MTERKLSGYIGLDIAKLKLDFYCETQGNRCFKNDPDGIAELVKLCQSIPESAVVCEATSHYHIEVTRQLQQAGIEVSIVNPRYVRSYAKALGYLEKTDAIDAKVLARFGGALTPLANALITESFLELQGLQTRQRQLASLLALEKTHQEGLRSRLLKEQVDGHIKILEASLAEVEALMDGIIQKTPLLAQKMKLLTSAKGIGAKTARLFIAQLPELGHLSVRAIAKLVGVAPLNNESGFMRGKRSIYGGRSMVRSGLYMATLSAIRFNLKIKSYYEHLIARGKVPKVAIVACMRKLLIILNSMVKNNENFILKS